MVIIPLLLGACTAPQTTPTPAPAAKTNTPVPIKPVVVTATVTPTKTPTVAPPAFAHPFHVEGSAFVDENGRPMTFCGMASPDIVQMVMRNNPNLSSFNEHYFQVMSEWGANIVRLPITPYSLHTFG